MDVFAHRIVMPKGLSVDLKYVSDRHTRGLSKPTSALSMVLENELAELARRVILARVMLDQTVDPEEKCYE
jgi:hypothetical protein